MMTQFDMKIMRMMTDNAHMILLSFSSQAMKLDVEYKEDKISSLGREVTDLENRGADQEEVRFSSKNISKYPKPFVQIAGPKNIYYNVVQVSSTCHHTVIQFSSDKFQLKTRLTKPKKPFN